LPGHMMTPPYYNGERDVNGVSLPTPLCDR
jgi:hypothetical protein